MDLHVFPGSMGALCVGLVTEILFDCVGLTQWEVIWEGNERLNEQWMLEEVLRRNSRRLRFRFFCFRRVFFFGCLFNQPGFEQCRSRSASTEGRDNSCRSERIPGQKSHSSSGQESRYRRHFLWWGWWNTSTMGAPSLQKFKVGLDGALSRFIGNRQPRSPHWEKLFCKSILSPRRVSGGRNSAGQVTAWAVPSLTCAGEGRTVGSWGQPGVNESTGVQRGT